MHDVPGSGSANERVAIGCDGRKKRKSPRSAISGGLLRRSRRSARDQLPVVLPLVEVVPPPTVNVLPPDDVDVLPEDVEPPDVLVPPGVKVDPPAL